jgi:hypothetical protein
MSVQDRPIEWQHQEAIISQLLDGRLTPKTAAPKLAAVTLLDPNSDIDDEDDEEEILVDLERIFNMMLKALEARPESVHTILDLIICISQLPSAPTELWQAALRNRPCKACLGRSPSSQSQLGY